VLICVCNGISDRDIDSVLQDGAASFKEVRSTLGLGSNCGQCTAFAKEIVGEKMAQVQASKAFHLAQEIRL